MRIKQIIRIDKVTLIDDVDIISYDLVMGVGISSRGYVKKSHIEKTLVLFNRFRMKI